ncbi:MAG TPA: MarR family transcriptional regulator [Stellaceae bacterium]|nr:MarR family transcriptional regulator [Stellaceae bacterium]
MENRALGGAARRRTAKLSTPEFRLDDHIFFLFTQIFGRRNRQLAAKLKPLAITVPQWRILAVLNERAGSTMNELADLTTVDRTTLTRTLDRMVRADLVTRRSNAHDGRSIRLYLTAAGEAAFRRVLPRVLEQNERAVRGFSAAELAELRAKLHHMIRNLDPD